jgi:hypothetical protein
MPDELKQFFNSNPQYMETSNRIVSHLTLSASTNNPRIDYQEFLTVARYELMDELKNKINALSKQDMDEHGGKSTSTKDDLDKQ